MGSGFPQVCSCLQGSIKLELPWLVPLQRRKMPEREWKFVMPLFLLKISCSCETSECLEVVSNLQHKNF